MQTGRDGGGHWRSPLAGFPGNVTKTSFNARTPQFRIAVEVSHRRRNFRSCEISFHIERRSEPYV
jgi:hypothetical protein